MPALAILIGATLTALSLAAYFSPDLLAGGKVGQPSALSPAGVGVVLILAGVASALKPAARKHAMHLAAVVALLGTLGGLVPMFLRKFDFGQTAVLVGAGMTGLSAIFLILCVKSFIDARKARTAAAFTA